MIDITFFWIPSILRSSQDARRSSSEGVRARAPLLPFSQLTLDMKTLHPWSGGLRLHICIVSLAHGAIRWSDQNWGCDPKFAISIDLCLFLSFWFGWGPLRPRQRVCLVLGSFLLNHFRIWCGSWGKTVVSRGALLPNGTPNSQFRPILGVFCPSNLLGALRGLAMCMFGSCMVLLRRFHCC